MGKSKNHFEQIKESLELMVDQLNHVKAFNGRELMQCGDIRAYVSQSFNQDAIIAGFHALTLKERLADIQQDVRIQVPATWWQHLKRDSAPEWFLRRFPVQHETITKTVVCHLDAQLLERAREYLQKTEIVRGKVSIHFSAVGQLDRKE